ncbi:MAG TPA: phage holin family protein [Herpetosiphonaceae bacterium]
MQRQEDTRSLGELFSELANETTTLVRQEIQLVRTEMTQKATQAGKDVGMIGAGGALAYAGLLALIAALIIGLGELIPLWLSALIVGLVVVGIGYMLIQRGLTALKQIDPKPQQTIQTLQEDKEWVKEQP